MSAAAHEIDLIPADYRSERALSRLLRRAGIGMLALICAATVLSAGLRYATTGVRGDIQRLDAAAAGVELQRASVAALTQRKLLLEAELAQLRGLRGGTVVTDGLGTVDRALPDAGLWFLEWRFERLASASGAPALEMTIIGGARDHAAVSGFVSAMLSQPGVEDVRILRTSREGEADVGFELLVIAAGTESPT